MNVAVVLDGIFDERGVEDGKLLQRFDGGHGDEGHVGELEAVTLFEGGSFAVAEADDARHVDFVDGVGVRDGVHALGHARGDDGAHFGHRYEVAC